MNLRQLADTIAVKDGGMWPINPATGNPICDRCECDAVRVSYSSPDTAVFFCAACDEHDACDVDTPILRRDGDPNAPVAVVA